MTNQDIRWHQRLANFIKALAQLEKGVALMRERELSDLEQQGLIKAFEFTHELAWNVMKDFFEHQGNMTIKGSRDAIREAFKRDLISDGETWMQTITSRQKTVHTYNEDSVGEIACEIADDYLPIFQAFRETMTILRNKEQNEKI